MIWTSKSGSFADPAKGSHGLPGAVRISKAWRGGGSDSFGRGRTSQGPGEAMNHPNKGTNLSPRSLIEFPNEHANG
jgi:hypothetical protein